MKKILALIILISFSKLGFSQAGEIISVQKLNQSNSTYIKNNISDIAIGLSLTNIGDLDGNGYNDIVVGGTEESTLDGVIVVLFLEKDAIIMNHSIIGKSKGGLNTDIPNNFSGFGESIDNIGDLDGDNVNDLVVGNDASNFGGEIFILFMKSDGTIKTHKRITGQKNGFNVTIGTDQAFGYAVGGGGDLNGDNVEDIIVGDINDDDGGFNRGAIYILFLNSDGTVKTHQKISSITGGFDGVNDQERFGSSITRLDSNKIVVGAYIASNGVKNAGAIWILNITQSGSIKNETKITAGMSGFSDTLSDLAHFGFSISNIGDINGDDIPDLLVGADQYDDINTRSGASFLLFMGNDDNVKSYKRYSNSVGDLGYTLESNFKFGRAITGIGDINGDSKYDFAVGVPGERSDGVPWGGIHVLIIDGAEHVGVNTVVKQPLKIYPNPAGNSITIDNTNLTSTNYTVTIFDITGRQVYAQAYNSNASPEIDISRLKNGVYQVMVSSDNEIYQSKLIIQH